MNYNDIRKNAYTSASKSSSGIEKAKIALQNNQIISKGLLKVPENETNQNANTSVLQTQNKKKQSVYEKVAKFLILLGMDEASKILPLLSEEQTEKIIPEIANIKFIDENEAFSILNEFEALLTKVEESGGKGTAYAILEKAYGKEKAEKLFKRASEKISPKPFEFIKNIESEKILALLNEESVQVQTLVLSSIEPQKAASIINLMKEKNKNEIIIRLAKMEAVNPEVLKKVSDTLQKKAEKIEDDNFNKLDGKNALAEILKHLPYQSEMGLLSSLEEEDKELSDDLRQRLFTLDDIINCDDKFIQNEISDWENLTIAKLISNKNEKFRNKILSNVSTGRKAMIIDEEYSQKPFLISDVNTITQIFVKKVREAFEDGKVIVKGRNDESFVK